MKLISDEIGDNFENEFFDGLVLIFSDFEQSFLESMDGAQKLSISDYSALMMTNLDFLIGEPIQKAAQQVLNNRVHQYFLNSMKKVQYSVAGELDKLNNLGISNSPQTIQRLQENAVFKRRWRIVSNRLTRTIKKRIKSQVDYAIKNNLRVETLDRSITEVFQKYNKGKAVNTRTIARTEMNSVLRTTEWDYSREFEKALKIKLQKHWFTRDDEEVRSIHNGYFRLGWILKYDYFIFDNVRIRYPHDPKADAENVINCRCRLRFRELKEKIKRRINEITKIIQKQS